MNTDDLGPLPEVHPRHDAVEAARTELMGLAIDWRKRHGLTLAEELMLLSELLNDRLRGAVKTERRKT